MTNGARTGTDPVLVIVGEDGVYTPQLVRLSGVNLEEGDNERLDRLITQLEHDGREQFNPSRMEHLSRDKTAKTILGMAMFLNSATMNAASKMQKESEERLTAQIQAVARGEKRKANILAVALLFMGVLGFSALTIGILWNALNLLIFGGGTIGLALYEAFTTFP